jgi:peroxiredoxin Q/BCP
MKAIDFSLPDKDGKVHKLSDYLGKWVVVYFYPKDDTPGCTLEACQFRDKSGDLTALGIVVLGISKDSVASHKKFAEKHTLNFPILSDESKETIKAYGAWGEKKFMGKIFDGVLRNTYLIDAEGNLVKTYKNVTPLSHAAEIIADVKELKK